MLKTWKEAELAKYRIGGYRYALTGSLDDYGLSPPLDLPAEQAVISYLAKHPPGWNGLEDDEARDAFLRGVLDAMTGLRADKEASRK